MELTMDGATARAGALETAISRNVPDGHSQAEIAASMRVPGQ